MKVKKANNIIDLAANEYGEFKVIALFSGGHDSLVSTYITSQHPLFAGVLHINTGTGIPETTQYVKDVCKQYGWQFHIFSPAVHTYLNTIQNEGFPGPAQHTLMYRYLKERPLDAARRSLQQDGVKVAWVTGARLFESERRARNVQTHRKDKHGIWINVIHDWTSQDCDDLINNNNLPRNPVKDAIGMSGECLCGAYASPDEYRLISALFPSVGERIKRWESVAKLAREVQQKDYTEGFRDKPPFDKKYCKWGYRSRIADEQITMPGFDMQTLCTSCTGDHLNREMNAVKKLKELGINHEEK